MLILASQSPYKLKQLSVLGLPLHTRTPQVEENFKEGEAPEQAARRLARLKARAIQADHPHATVIGSDQTAHLEGQSTILRKPGSIERAKAQLHACSGRTVLLHSAVSILHPERPEQTYSTTTRVTFRTLDEDTISRYIEIESPLDCVGAFKCEGLGISLFTRIESDDPTALIGLPMIHVCTALRAVGYTLP